MPDFAYTARNLKGELVNGTLAANTEREVINMLSGQSLFPVNVSEQKVRQQAFGGRVNAQTMSSFYSQLAGLLRSGVPLLRSLRILEEQASSVKFQQILKDVHSKVEDGESFGDCLVRYPNIFNDIAVNMCRAGAEGGFLEDALDRLGQFTEEQADLKARTLGALMYPIILVTIGSAIVSVLIVFFVPKFKPMFDQLSTKGELPWMTTWLLNFSSSIQSRWYLFALVFIGIFMAIYALLQSESGKRIFDRIKLVMPMFGDIFRNLAVARFCRVLGTMLKNGVPILKSLEISSAAAGNRILSDAVTDASENITAGASLAKPLATSGHFPRTVVEMISVAEESNTLDTVLVDISDNLEKRTTRKLDLMVRMLEPLMLVVLGGIVLFVVIALLLPVMKMSSMMRA
ncbi:MAG: type II secretion system F family protein [Planctomycetota bacterium]|nr:type II secretion system F family protein [Planctomycetota bacterium]